MILLAVFIIGLSSFLFFFGEEELEMIEGGVIGGAVGIGGDRIRISGDEEEYTIDIMEEDLSIQSLELSNEGYVYFVNRDPHIYTVEIVREGTWNLRTNQKLRVYIASRGEYDFNVVNDEQNIRLEGNIVY